MCMGAISPNDDAGGRMYHGWGGEQPRQLGGGDVSHRDDDQLTCWGVTDTGQHHITVCGLNIVSHVVAALFLLPTGLPRLTVVLAVSRAMAAANWS